MGLILDGVWKWFPMGRGHEDDGMDTALRCFYNSATLAESTLATHCLSSVSVACALWRLMAGRVWSCELEPWYSVLGALFMIDER